MQIHPDIVVQLYCSMVSLKAHKNFVNKIEKLETLLLWFSKQFDRFVKTPCGELENASEVNSKMSKNDAKHEDGKSKIKMNAAINSAGTRALFQSVESAAVETFLILLIPICLMTTLSEIYCYFAYFYSVMFCFVLGVGLLRCCAFVRCVIWSEFELNNTNTNHSGHTFNTCSFSVAFFHHPLLASGGLRHSQSTSRSRSRSKQHAFSSKPILVCCC